MNQDLQDILDFIKEAGNDFTTLTVEKEGFFFELDKSKPEPVCITQPAVAAAPAPAAAQPAVQQTAEEKTDEPQKPDNAKEIKSPLVGIFRELEGARKVKIGDKLKKGDTVCNIEAMKLLNDLNMPEDGEIVWIAASDGDAVEYDQVLFHYI